MTKAVTENTKKQEIALANDLNEWGPAPISNQDMIIPMLLVQQPMAKRVTAGTAKFGDLIESLNDTVIGDPNTPTSIIPFYMEKVFTEYKVDGKEKEYLRMVPITNENEGLPYEDEGEDREGKKCKISRDKCLNFYVLLESELKDGGGLPYIISFRRTSLRAGKKLATQMYVKNMQAGLTPASVVCDIVVNKTTHDSHTFATLDTVPGKRSKDEYVVEALKWLKVVKSGKAKVHEDALEEEREVVDIVDEDNMKY
jgi:hypothetical protein